MDNEQFQDRVIEVLCEESAEPVQWHYFSFADEKFNGAVIIQCCGIGHGTMLTHALGINPGGQVMAVPMPDEMLPPEKYRNRLLSREDVQEFWPDAKTLREHEVEAAK